MKQVYIEDAKESFESLDNARKVYLYIGVVPRYTAGSYNRRYMVVKSEGEYYAVNAYGFLMDDIRRKPVVITKTSGEFYVFDTPNELYEWMKGRE